jgi:nicotinate-nucleotide adenylyltransferase
MGRGKPDLMRAVEMISSEKIGLFGGSFDPIHHGHLILARDAMESLGLDRVIFIPVNVSPHKLAHPPVAARLRCEMVAAAIAGESRFSMDACEAEREGPSFAVDTVRVMRRRFPQAELFYFIGEDNVSSLHTWREIDELKKLASFVVLARGNLQPVEGFPVISRNIDISSTDIRNRIAQGLPVRYLLPDAVCAILTRHQLYLND